jgi:hypothetical protein
MEARTALPGNKNEGGPPRGYQNARSFFAGMRIADRQEGKQNGKERETREKKRRKKRRRGREKESLE